MTRRTSLGLAGACCVVLLGSACGGPGPAPSVSVGPAPVRTPTSPAPATTPAQVPSDRDFDPAKFSNSTTVTNPYFPLDPGTRFTWKGHAFDDGERVDRAIEFTVTDMTKVVDGVRTVVAWDRDFTDGELEEIELAFFAQDDAGTVWFFGEYPEEVEGKKIVKSPLWLAGLRKARPGIMMHSGPRAGTPDYAEGWGGTDVDWTDRGKVDKVGVKNCVPTGCYTDVVVIDEFSREEPGKHQLKYYAPSVGGIRTGWRGAKEDEKEELALVSLEHLDASQVKSVRKSVLDQEARAYERHPDVYGKTEPMEKT